MVAPLIWTSLEGDTWPWLSHLSEPPESLSGPSAPWEFLTGGARINL